MCIRDRDISTTILNQTVNVAPFTPLATRPEIAELFNDGNADLEERFDDVDASISDVNNELNFDDPESAISRVNRSIQAVS